MNHPTQHPVISIPITKVDRQIAQQFAQEQSNTTKTKQVYLNTLAVLVMYHYLQMLDVPTDLQASHSWNVLGRLSADVADLNLPGRGHLECRPILKGEDTCDFPQEVWTDRIGYVVVEFNETYKQGNLLGFVPQVSSTTLPISQLQPLDMLLIALHSSQPVVQLSQWLENIFTAGWQSVEDILGTKGNSPVLVFADILPTKVEVANFDRIKDFITQLYTSQANSHLCDQTAIPDSHPSTALIHLLQTTQDEEIRWKAAELLWEIDPDNLGGGVRRAIDLGMHFGNNAVALMVAILPKPDQRIAILMKVYPLGSHPHLPAGLQLIGLDTVGNSFFTVQARRRDNYIQFKFTADPGDRFNLRVALGDASITQSFIV